VALAGKDLLVANSQLDKVLSGQALEQPLSVVRLSIPAVTLQQDRVVDGFAGPESVWWDAAARRWYVTNYGGDGFGTGPAKDGNGYVSRLRADGTVDQKTFATGLNTPNGIRGWRGRLLVADLDRLVVLDARTGRTLREIAVPGARFLNDVAIDDRTGDAYVSDTFTDTIWRLRPSSAGTSTSSRPALARLGAGGLEVFVRDVRLEAPNGLLVDGRTLLVGSAGPSIDPATFQTAGPGRLLTVDLPTRAISRYGTLAPIGAVDGIEKDRRGYLITEIGQGKVLRVTPHSVTTLGTFGPGQAADLGYDPARRRTAVPALFNTTVTFSHLTRPTR
jgi:sugar lactone lactonase YvrE